MGAEGCPRATESGCTILQRSAEPYQSTAGNVSTNSTSYVALAVESSAARRPRAIFAHRSQITWLEAGAGGDCKRTEERRIRASHWDQVEACGTGRTCCNTGEDGPWFKAVLLWEIGAAPV